MTSALDTVYYYVVTVYDNGDYDELEYYDTYEEAKEVFEEEKGFFGITSLRTVRLCSQTAYVGSTKVLKKYTYDDYVDDKYGAYAE